MIERRIVNIFTGPPKDKADDDRLMHEFMHCEGKKVVSGGTSSNIAARFLGKEIVTRADSADPDVPPVAEIEGIDLVTEGVLTLGKCLKLLKKYANDEFDEEFFDELDADNGASRLAKMLIEECTELNLFVGTSVNKAHKNSELSFDLSMRMNLVEQLIRIMEQIGRNVTVKYTDTGWTAKQIQQGFPGGNPCCLSSCISLLHKIYMDRFKAALQMYHKKRDRTHPRICCPECGYGLQPPAPQY